MPELPEVEVVCRGLNQALSEQPRIEKFEFRRHDLRHPLPIRRLNALAGERILSVTRRAKFLLFTTTHGGFLSHLGMTGSWRLEQGLVKPGLHDHVLLHLQNGKILVYRDPRRFGVLDTWSPEESSARLMHLGPEPWSEEFSLQYLWQKSRKRTQTIKALIMDQRIVVGVGNIYASEALFLAGIKPTRPAGRVTSAEWQKLRDVIREVLQKAIDAGGSSISDFYSFAGVKGDFQNLHAVYGRADLACFRCETKIREKVLAGRNSFWCVRCQK